MEPLWHIELLIFFLTFASNSHLEKGLLLVLFQLDSELYTFLTANTAEATDSSLFFFLNYLMILITYLLLQLMQGNIRLVPSPQGLAQSMALVLRFQLRPSIAIAISEPGESSEQPPSNSLFRGLQVLLADDDDVNRAVTRKLLEKLGCTVTAVSSGFECLAAIGPSGSSIQIILLDLHMPDLDGFDVAARLRQFRSRSWPLIVALTASADEDVWDRCMHIGINGIIQKPVLLQGIANELRRVLIQANKVV